MQTDTDDSNENAVVDDDLVRELLSKGVPLYWLLGGFISLVSFLNSLAEFVGYDHGIEVLRAIAELIHYWGLI